MSSKPELIDPFKVEFQQAIEEFGLTEHQIYIAGETGLNWQLLPDKTYVSIEEKIRPT